MKYNSNESETQSRIFDIFRNNVKYDLGKLHSTEINSIPTTAYSSAIGNLNNNYILAINAQKRTIYRRITDLVNEYKALSN